MIKPEDQFFIIEVEIYISRDGQGVVDPRHVQSEDDYNYYKIDGDIEKRYKIKHYAFSSEHPAKFYETACSREASIASGCITRTRRYRRQIDNTYFKYYDDAQEVLDNIISFIQWLKNPPSLAKKTMKEILEQNGYLLKERSEYPDLEELRRLQIGLNVKRRDKLKPLARDLADELDLV